MAKTKQPYGIAMKDGSPFGVAGLWENWKSPAGEWWHLRDHHHGLERIGTSNRRPHAGRPPSG
jgi:hypothetical protein